MSVKLYNSNLYTDARIDNKANQLVNHAGSGDGIITAQCPCTPGASDGGTGDYPRF